MYTCITDASSCIRACVTYWRIPGTHVCLRTLSEVIAHTVKRCRAVMTQGGDSLRH